MSNYVVDRAKKLNLKVIDSEKPLVIAVTGHDVVNALKSDSKRCALARAAERIPGVLHGYFFRTTAYLEYKNKMIRFTLPMSVQKEIVSFDRAQIFAPGVYQLSSPGNTRERARATSKTRVRTDRSVEYEARKAKRKGKAVEGMPKMTFTAVSGDKGAAEFMTKMAAITQKALNGKGKAPKGVKLSSSKEAPTKKSLVTKTQYVRDLKDPDAGKK